MLWCTMHYYFWIFCGWYRSLITISIFSRGWQPTRVSDYVDMKQLTSESGDGAWAVGMEIENCLKGASLGTRQCDTNDGPPSLLSAAGAFRFSASKYGLASPLRH